MIGLLAVLAAIVSGGLAVRILLQRRRTPPSTATARAATSAAHSSAAPDGLARLDTALRTLAHHLTRDGEQDLPQLRAARIDADHLAVLPEDQALRPLEPFRAGPDGWWQLPGDADLLDEETARTVPAPYPALATIGTTPTGGQDALLLLNLAHPPALLLDGDLPHVKEALTALALELVTSPWAADIDIITVGFGEDLPHLTPVPRTTHLPHATDAVREMSERLLEAGQLPRPGPRPYLLLSAHPLEVDLAAHVAELIEKAAPLPLSLIAPAHPAAPCFPQALILNASLDEPQPVDYLDTTVSVQRLTDHAYQRLTATLKPLSRPATQDSPATGAAPSPRMTAPAPKQITADATAIADVLVPATNGPSTADNATGFPALRAAAHQQASTRTPAASTTHAHATPPGTQHSAAADPQPDSDPTPQAGTPPRQKTTLRPTGAQEQAPEIRVLGPVEVTGVRPSGHGPRTAQLAALLYFKPGRTADELCTDMDPTNPWTLSTLNARLHGLRRALGNDPTGQPYVPRRTGADTPYQLSDRVHCDWTRFLNLTETADSLGPAGLPHLEEALTLVRGRPFGPRPLPWAEPYQQEMTTRIIDVAHTVATYRTPPGPHHNLTAARHAVATGLDIDDSAEALYRDWMRIEHAAGNRPGLHTVISRLQHVHRTLNVAPEKETEELIDQLLANPSTPPASQR
ncbi:hypothetical protein ACPF8X_02385 [Streptomyces sp. G35A]